MLSLCMIVKDEEKTLEICLSNAVNFVDEIIVVDTGSADKTKEVALKYTDKVYDFKWCNDFSKARNFSIEKASNSWIVILDADEFIDNEEEINIKEFCNDANNEVVGRIKIVNEYEDNYGTKRYIERVNRIFNKNYFEYEGIIHEQIVSKNRRKYNTKNVGLTINHIGYNNEIVKKTNKLERNINLLKIAIEEKANDPYMYYQLGKSYFMGKDFTKACSSFEKALSVVDNFYYEYAEDLVESYGYSLINLNLFNEALKLYKYEQFYSNSPDFLFLLALIEMNNGGFQKAIEIFLKCTNFSEGKMEGITSFLPLYNVGAILECLGFENEAKKYYLLCKDYPLALQRIKNNILNN